MTYFSCTKDNIINGPSIPKDEEFALVWQQVDPKYPEKWKWQIQYMTQDTSFAVTNDTNWNTNPSICGDSIVWASPDGINLWYRGNTIRLYDDPNLYEQNPVISQDLITWFAEDTRIGSNTSEIYAFTTTGLKRITNNTYRDGWPCVYGDTIFWGVDTSGYTAIHSWTSDTSWTFTADSLKARGLKKSGNCYVWFAYDGNDNEIVMMKNDLILKLTSNSLNDWYPDIYGDKIIWVSGSNSKNRDDHEIMIWENGQVKQLTHNNVEEKQPIIRGKYIVWYSKDTSATNDNEIYMYDGNEIRQITNNEVEDTDPDFYLKPN